MPDDAIMEIEKPDNEKFRNTATTSFTSISLNTSSASSVGTTSYVNETTTKSPSPVAKSSSTTQEVETTTSQTTTTYIPGKGRRIIVL